ncbi:hypothetical protein SAMN05216274_110104 [Cryobacterium levicorallinum]|uniref:Uncharacterized protein n=1 Tax=Cryobacterium levicorallinum TaxID=995038 RepID=A0ABY1EF91_9MICO|nr:hypothetical protein SAMN05216274_110104 [Cryobacterium levicorallinum]
MGEASLPQVVQERSRRGPRLLEIAQLNVAIQDVVNSGADLCLPDLVDLPLIGTLLWVQAGQQTVRDDSAFSATEIESCLVNLISFERHRPSVRRDAGIQEGSLGLLQLVVTAQPPQTRGCGMAGSQVDHASFTLISAAHPRR